MLGKFEGRRRRTTEDEIVAWHHQLNGHEFEQALGNSEGQGSLVCCSPWGHKESDMIEQLNNSNLRSMGYSLRAGEIIVNETKFLPL